MQGIPIVHLVAILSLTDGPLSDAAYSPSATESAVTAPSGGAAAVSQLPGNRRKSRSMQIVDRATPLCVQVP